MMLHQFGNGHSLSSQLVLIFSLASIFLAGVSLVEWRQLRWLIEKLRSIINLPNSHVKSVALRDSSLKSSEWISRWTGKWHGAARISTLVLVILCLFIGVIAGGVIGSPGPALEETHYNVFFPKVPQKMPSNEYKVKNLDIRDKKHYGTEGKWKFCKDVPKVDEYGNELTDKYGITIMEDVPFDEGEMLLEISFIEYGVCKKVTYWRALLDSSNKVMHEAPYTE